MADEQASARGYSRDAPEGEVIVILSQTLGSMSWGRGIAIFRATQWGGSRGNRQQDRSGEINGRLENVSASLKIIRAYRGLEKGPFTLSGALLVRFN